MIFGLGSPLQNILLRPLVSKIKNPFNFFLHGFSYLRVEDYNAKTKVNLETQEQGIKPTTLYWYPSLNYSKRHFFHLIFRLLINVLSIDFWFLLAFHFWMNPNQDKTGLFIRNPRNFFCRIWRIWPTVVNSLVACEYALLIIELVYL